MYPSVNPQYDTSGKQIAQQQHIQMQPMYHTNPPISPSDSNVMRDQTHQHNSQQSTRQQQQDLHWQMTQQSIANVGAPSQEAMASYTKTKATYDSGDQKVDHFCHCLLCHATCGCWCWCWIGACCGWCCRKPCK